MATRVVIMAGGTGGHVFPALAVAGWLRERGCEVTWIGTRKGLEARLVPEAGIPMDWIDAEGVRGRGMLERVKAVYRLAKAFVQALGILRRRKPQVALGLGGFASAPGGLAAWLLRVPLVIHEQNRVPGTSNRLLAVLARKVLEAFPDSFPYKAGALCTGNPLRREVAALREREPRATGAPLKLLVLGGSQGASALNRLVPEAAAKLEKSLAIRHQSGAPMYEETRELYARYGVQAEVTAFIADMAEAYRWADVAVCRAGAMTVSELCAAGLPAVLVPFPYAIDDHQTANARYLADAGAARLAPQAGLDASRLAGWLQEFQDDAAGLAAMADAARKLAMREAARTVGEICLAEAKA
ncbi:MAG TPA: undecaprenyldiphospho-muramoylpentapeptide beta-N-acetylglucosaminyltransferase [Methylococcaceae bacterium]|nr:undecaprenyldiphospho-muramoylpentapeptide beta-N-acetylglucosaminyltransferase [Methylococcaceae bacterium]